MHHHTNVRLRCTNNMISKFACQVSSYTHQTIYLGRGRPLTGGGVAPLPPPSLLERSLDRPLGTLASCVLYGSNIRPDVTFCLSCIIDKHICIAPCTPATIYDVYARTDTHRPIALHGSPFWSGWSAFYIQTE